MNYEQLKGEVQQIAQIASSMPEAFRDKCFELLLTKLLAGQLSDPLPPPSTDTAPPPAPKVRASSDSSMTVPANVRAFMRRKGVTQEQLEAIVMVEDGEVHFLKEPAHGQAAKGQTDWALLLALRNGLLTNTLKADPEEVRSMVQEKGFYDPANYAANFKKPKYAELFRSLLEPQGEAQALSQQGETALADLIKSLVGST